MSTQGSSKHIGQGRFIISATLLAAILVLATTATAIPPPTPPYTITRWVDDWSYTAGEVLDVKLRIVTNDVDTSGMLNVQINEGFEPAPEGWQLVAVDDITERVIYTSSTSDGVHGFSVNVQGDFPSPFEFVYRVTVPEEMTGRVRITALLPEVQGEEDYRSSLPTVVTDLYPPGLPDIEEGDTEALDNYASQLRQQGDEEGWTFEVATNDIVTRDAASLLGTDLDLMPSAGERKVMTFPKINPKALPPRLDLRTTGPVIPVRDQGNCGSCWAFALVSVAEKLVAIQDGIAVKFSEQWVLDCNTDNWNCSGGWNPYKMFVGTDVCGEQGLVLEAVLPYQQMEIGCDCDKPRTAPYPFEYIGSIDENQPLANKVAQIKQAVMDYGPVWTTVFAGNDPFFWYQSGVFNYKPQGGSIDHAVVIEGWDDDRGNGVWIMRNSWGEGWGDKGYMLIEYDSSLIGSYTDVIRYAGSPNGSITVVIMPQAAIDAGAQWRVDDGPWFNSGDTLPNVAPGAYTVSYKAIAGFTTPADESVQVEERENITLTAQYEEVTEGEGEEGEDLPQTPNDIAEFLIQHFDEIDGDNSGTLTYGEIIAVLPHLTPTLFSILDLNSDTVLTVEELRAFLEGTDDPVCCGTCAKSGSLGQRVKRQLGDWLLLGVTLLTLASLGRYRKTRL